MMVTLYRRTRGGATRYVTITDRQGHLFGYPTLTEVEGKDFFLVRERHHTFQDVDEQQNVLQQMLRRRISRGYRVLYSFFRETGEFGSAQEIVAKSG